MENRAKPRFPRTLLSPFASCKAHKLISDVILHHHLRRRPRPHPQQGSLIPYSSTSIEPLLPPPTSSITSSVRKPPAASHPSMCKPRCPETFNEMIRDSCILSIDRHKIHPSNDAVRGGWMRCPHGSPFSTQNLKQEKKQKHKSNKDHMIRSRCIYDYEDWFSSDDEREDDDETESGTDSDAPFSSSRSFLSLTSSKSVSITSDPDSFEPPLARRPPSARRREARRKKEKGTSQKMKGSFAVVKSSSDPYSDFRASMVEMIMEKQIYGARELEQLLQCFLSLNSPHHHKAIVEVFAEICDALLFNRLGL